MVIHDISRWPLIDDMEISNEKKKKKHEHENVHHNNGRVHGIEKCKTNTCPGREVDLRGMRL